MQVIQIPVRNPLRNYMYLLVCENQKVALAIDPLDHALCLQTAEKLNVKIKYVVNTHHHHDHIGGNVEVLSATGATLAAHQDTMDTIPNVELGLNAGDSLQVGDISFSIMDTPGHTMSHICLFYAGNTNEAPALFCGDTLFNAGVGRCDLGGAAEVMYQTFKQQLFTLQDDVRVYPGHDYIVNNLGFTLAYEPDNSTAESLLEQFNNGLDAETYVTTIGLERKINTFFRLDSPTIRKRLKTDNDESTFIALRAERNNW